MYCTPMRKVVVVLDNIRSVYNVGSIFRTADGFGVSKIYLCGTTPEPIDRFGRARKDIAKVALGAEQSVEWEYFEKTTDVISKLKKEGVEIVAVEQADNSVSYKENKVSDNVAFVFGNEVDGVSESVLKESDRVVEISMKGEKESFNVSVTVGIILANT